MLRAAARRLAIVLLAVTGGIGLTAFSIGLLLGTSPSRAVSLGFYLGGCFLLVGGFFIGNRGPARPKGEGPSMFGPRFMRWATPEEREDTLNTSAVFVTIGLVLILLGTLVDPRVQLF